MLRELKSDKGFTLVELLMVFIILGIMAQMSLTFVMDLRSRSHDLMALSDGRNFVTVVRNNFISRDDVDYSHNPGDGSGIGDITFTTAAPRPPVFTMSPGVRVTITGESDPDNPGTGLVVATFYHDNGTNVPTTPSGKKEFFYVIDELGTDTLATF